MNAQPDAAVAAHSVPNSQPRSSAVVTIAWAGFIAGVLDIGYVIVFYGIKGVAATRILQGVAAGLIGRDAAVKGDLATAGLGLAIHFSIAVCVAAVFYAISRKLRVMIERPLVSGLLYGAAVWLIMNLVVMPLTATPPKSFPSPGWLPVFVAHLICVGLPIALVVRWREREHLQRNQTPDSAIE